MNFKRATSGMMVHIKYKKGEGGCIRESGARIAWRLREKVRRARESAVRGEIEGKTKTTKK